MSAEVLLWRGHPNIEPSIASYNCFCIPYDPPKLEHNDFSTGPVARGLIHLLEILRFPL